MNKKLSVAIVHDYIKEYGGAERVLEELIKIYPDADIYTSVFLPKFLGPHRKRFENYKISTSILQLVPFKAKLISPIRLISPLIFKSFDLSSYDLIIVSQTGAYFPNFVKKGNAKLICYTHTPPRYLYGYMTAREWKKNGFMRVVGSIMNHFLRIVDYNASKNVDQFIANSQEVKARIEKYYRRDAAVIYPPVTVQKVNVISHKENYYLCGGRLARAKGIDIIIKAFNMNGKKLKVFGRGFAGFEEQLKKIARNNIEFVGEVEDREKLNLFAGAKAFVFASFDEDFGITPVEAMGTGAPVVAFKSGGVKETVVNEKTGIFFDENTPESLNKAIKRLEAIKIKPEDCIEQAEKFSKDNFDRKIKEFVKGVI